MGLKNRCDTQGAIPAAWQSQYRGIPGRDVYTLGGSFLGMKSAARAYSIGGSSYLYFFKKDSK
jgi:hypothetical protein